MPNLTDYEVAQEDDHTREPLPPQAVVVDISGIQVNKLLLTQANTLAKSAYSMTLNERKLLALAMAHVRIDDECFYCYRIPIKIIEEALNLNPTDSYREVENVATKLLARVLKIDSGLKRRNGKTRWKAFQWVSYCEYLPREESPTGEACLKVQIHLHLLPMLLNLQKHFGSIPISEMSAMQSIHSLRIFEILHFTALYDAQNKRFLKPKIEMKVLDLKVQLGIEENYDNFKDFRRDVLERAQRDCEVNTHLVFTWTETKGAHGKIEKLTFHVKYNKNYKGSQLPLLPSEQKQKLLPAVPQEQSQPRESGFKSAGEIAREAVKPQREEPQIIFDNALTNLPNYEKKRVLDIIESVPDKDKQAIVDEWNDAIGEGRAKQRWRYLSHLVKAYKQGKFTSTSELTLAREKKQREAEQARRRAEQEREKEKIKQLKERFHEVRFEKALELWENWSEAAQEQFLLMTSSSIRERFDEMGERSMMFLSTLADYMAENGYFPEKLRSFEAWQEATNTAALTPA